MHPAKRTNSQGNLDTTFFHAKIGSYLPLKKALKSAGTTNRKMAPSMTGTASVAYLSKQETLTSVLISRQPICVAQFWSAQLTLPLEKENPIPVPPLGHASAKAQLPFRKLQGPILRHVWNKTFFVYKFSIGKLQNSRMAKCFSLVWYSQGLLCTVKSDVYLMGPNSWSLPSRIFNVAVSDSERSRFQFFSHPGT